MATATPANLRKKAKALRGRLAGRTQQPVSLADMAAAVQDEAVAPMVRLAPQRAAGRRKA